VTGFAPADTAITAVAGADLRAAEYLISRIIEFERGQVVIGVASGGTSSIFGGIYTKADSGSAVAIAVEQEFKLRAGAACGSRQRVTADGQGRAIIATSGTWSIGAFLEDVTMAGAQVRVLLQAYRHGVRFSPPIIRWVGRCSKRRAGPGSRRLARVPLGSRPYPPTRSAHGTVVKTYRHSNLEAYSI